MPNDHPTLSDKLESHRAGQKFKYAVITNKPSDDRKHMLDMLRSFKPSSRTEDLTLDQIPFVRLIGDVSKMSLTEAIGKDGMKGILDYTLIDCILIHFIPLDSFAEEKSVVTIQLNDFRKKEGTVARKCRVDSTMGYNVLFCLDFCVESRDLHRMTLSFSSDSRNFQEGVSWGAVKVVAQIKHSTAPTKSPLIDTMGVMLFSDTDLDEFQSDPRELDLVITPESLRKLREAKLRGEIENKTLPSDDKKEIVTARTVIGPDPGDLEVPELIEAMKEKHLLAERQRSAQSVNRARLQELKKEGSGSSEQQQVAESGGLEDLGSVGASEAFSGQDIEEEDADFGFGEVSNAELKPKKVLKFVD